MQNVYTYAIQYQNFKLVYPHNLKDSENTINYIFMMYIKQILKLTNKQIKPWNRSDQEMGRRVYKDYLYVQFGKIKSFGNTSNYNLTV